MPRSVPDKRTRLIDTAARLTHEQGYNRTTLADIARESGVPLGNVYYYFSTKEALGEALVDRMNGAYESLRARWNANEDPKARLNAFIQMTIDNRDVLARSGCPVGTLCAELHKAGGPLADHAATLFDNILKWLEQQFRRIGKSGAESRDLAAHVLSALEGGSLLTHTFHDPRFAVREANRLKEWIRDL